MSEYLKTETIDYSMILPSAMKNTYATVEYIRQGAGAANGKDKTSGDNDGEKKVQEDFDIDMDAPETEKAAVAIQSQFRKFQKKKSGSQS